MSDIVKMRVSQAKAKSIEEERNVLREVIQEIALLGLWRSKFFEKAAFYGGTALRMLYGLDRFSEDLDFTLLKKTSFLDMNKYLKAVVTELESFGFETSASIKEKSIDSPIQSAFVKVDSYMSFVVVQSRFKSHRDSVIKVKLEIDMDAVPGFETEAKQFFWPQPFSILTCTKPSLMAGKLHATFCRGPRNNVKGRDWYDLLWYVGQGTIPNWSYLENKLRDSGHWQGEFTPEKFCGWAKEVIKDLDVEAAKRDIRRFIKDPDRLSAWSTELFTAAMDRILVCGGA